ncbi:MAG: PDZ domain-containing protein [Candidatus Melainabacteria bacterium]|nr:PDZ domain-containing protein [Candidatus Melainabacteria bacterium]
MSNSQRKNLLLLVPMNVVLSLASSSALASGVSTEEPIAPAHQGSVSQTQAASGTGTANLNGTAAENAKLDAVDAKVDAESGKSDAASINGSTTITPTGSKPLQGKVVRKNSPSFGLFGRRWTTEDYRSLNYGILGIVMVRFPFSKAERITQLFPDCPAVQAGLRPGDVVVKIADHVLSGHETQKTTWHTADGVAGTHVEYTVKRHGQLLTFDLTRMNIEDIQNDSIRRMYERMLRELGPPGSVDRKQLEQQPSE